MAAAQHGLFTDRDAVASGYGRSARSYQRRAGNWLPTAAPGIWRLADLPRSERAARLEGLHAWALWLGPGWELTSWSTLDALGLVPAAALPRPVHVVWSAESDGLTQTRARRRQLEDARWSGTVVVHRVRQPRVPPIRLGGVDTIDGTDGLAVRPVAEALCLVVAHGVATGEAMPLEEAEALLVDLLARGAVDRSELLQTATALGAARVVNLLWDS